MNLSLFCTYSTIVSSNKKSQSSGSQVPMYLWGGSKVHKRIFMANLHRITIESQFQKWRTTFASAISDNVHVRLVEPSTDNMACTDSNDLDARIITFCPFHLSLSKVRQAINIPTKFREWRWLLSNTEGK